MAKAGACRVIELGNRLYSLVPQFIANKTERILDFGYCPWRMNVGAQQP